MDSKQAFSIFIAVIMTFSLVAVIFVFPQSSSPQDTGDNPPPDVNAPPAPIRFEATADANIAELFPSIFITSRTGEFQVGLIEKAIMETEGIKRLIKSGYGQPDEESRVTGRLAYSAEFSFDSKYSAEEIMGNLEESTDGMLTDIIGIRLGLVVFDKKQVLRNEDENITREYWFDNPVSNVYTTIDARQGDELTVSLSVTLSGEDLIEAIAYEIQNNTSSPKPRFASGLFELSSLDKRLVFYGDLNYSLRMDENSLKEALEGIEEVSSAVLYFNEPYPRLGVRVDGNVLERQDDINLLFSINPNITSYYFIPSEEELDIEVDFNSAVDLSTMELSLLSGLTALNIPQESVSFREPALNIEGDLNILSTASAEAAGSILLLLASKNIESVKLYQTGKSDVNSLTDLDTNVSYAIDANYLPFFIFPGHNAGESVDLNASFYSVRDKATTIRAVENK